MPSDMEVVQSDALSWLKSQPDDSIDLLMGSPPYEDRRTYGLELSRKGEEWVSWMFELWLEMDRVCKGLVVQVVEGFTKGFRYSSTPMLLHADLIRAGVSMRKPAVFFRYGVPGSGGTDFWRNDWEYCLCSSKGKLPWSDNTASGEAPVYGPGGNISNRMQDGSRYDKAYKAPEVANPGNVLRCKVGGGHMGSKLATDKNEAPYPERLVEPFVVSFCPPGGIVADVFSGSGTTAVVALRYGRKFRGCDLRQSQVEATKLRCQSVQKELFTGEDRPKRTEPLFSINRSKSQQELF